MKFTNPKMFIIFSANGQEDKVMRELLHQSIPFKKLQGVYNGQTEISIALFSFNSLQDIHIEEETKKYCYRFNQECYLKSENDRQTFLVYQDGRHKDIGKFEEVSKAIALERESYTYDPATESYYICIR